MVGASAPSAALTFSALKPIPIEPHMYGKACSLPGSLTETALSRSVFRFFQLGSLDLSSFW
ncbi:hypothetical protein D3C84_791230 [compost metagenome]